MPTLPSASAELIALFSAQHTWEDKYRQLILLSRQLPPMEAALKTPENEVRGCENRVWLSRQVREDSTTEWAGDSEGRIVKGLLAILLIAINGKTPDAIAQLDFTELFEQLGIASQLSASRQQGLEALIQRIKRFN